jgi:hypothetical protein
MSFFYAKHTNIAYRKAQPENTGWAFCVHRPFEQGKKIPADVHIISGQAKKQ